MDFVANVAPQAMQQFAQIKEQQYKADWEQGARLGSLGVHTETIKQEFDVGSAEIMAATNNQMATWLDGVGEYEQAAAIRKANSTQFDAWKSTQFKGYAQQANPTFWDAISNPNSQETYELNGERIPLNSLQGASTDELTRAWSRWFPEYMGMKGGYDVSPVFLHEGLRVGTEDWNNNITQYRKKELQGQKAEYIDQARTAFKIEVRDANTAVNAAVDIFQFEAADSQSLVKGIRNFLNILLIPILFLRI